jgi:phosphate transport system ATP-binding protein
MFGVRHTRRPPRRDWPERIEGALREAALWDEVRHRLREPAASLSSGQQQRLCLARVLAGEPEVLLLDEPTSALDAGATAAIEELIIRLRERHAIVLVTHGLRQAHRVADSLVFLAVRDGAGEVVEHGPCQDLFARPRTPELARYLSRESA